MGADQVRIVLDDCVRAAADVVRVGKWAAIGPSTGEPVLASRALTTLLGRRHLCGGGGTRHVRTCASFLATPWGRLHGLTCRPQKSLEAKMADATDSERKRLKARRTSQPLATDGA